MMDKPQRRWLPSLLMISGFIMLLLSASAIPSATEDSRYIPVIFAFGSMGLNFIGIVLSKSKPRNSKNE